MMNDNDNVSSQTVNIPSGDIEYVLVGNGPTVLISHGTMGGYDQALAISQLFNYELFSFLCVSRAGYLQSSPATGRTVAEQARSYKELLDHLGIAKIAIIGVSGGSPSAIRFAQDFPERCCGLILLASISQTPNVPPFFKAIIRSQKLVMAMEPLWKLSYKYGLKSILKSNGVNKQQTTAILDDPLLRKVAQDIYKPITSTRSRQQGLVLDDIQIQSLEPVENYDVRVPMLIGHAVNDPLAPIKDAIHLTTIFPEAEYHEFPDGGHLFFVVHSEKLMPTVEHFLQVHVQNDEYLYEN